MTERKPRRRATTEVGRQMLQRERQRLAREQASLGEALARTAASNNAMRDPRLKVTPERIGVSRGIVRRVAGVLASEEVTVPIKVQASGSDRTRAWTDFERIDVTYVDHEDKRLVAATLRGLLYHEGGHVRFTLPFPVLAHATNNQRGAWKDYQRAWNCLEDQRMETAVVSDSPRKAAYFTPMVMSIHTPNLDAMAANYPLLVWRKYLPRRIRHEARRLFITRHAMVHGQDVAMQLCEALEETVTRYVTATDVDTMWSAVVVYHNLLKRMQPLEADMSDAGHGQQNRVTPSNFAKPDPDALTIPISPDMLGDDFFDEPEADDEPEAEQADPTMEDLGPEGQAHIFEILAASMFSAETLITIQYVLQGSKAPDEKQDEGEDQQGGYGSLLDDDEDEQGGQSPSDASDDDDDEADEGDGGADEGDDDEDDLDDASDGEPEDAETQNDDEGDHKDAPGGSHGSHASDDAGIEEEPFSQDDLDEVLQDAEEERYNQRDLDGDMREYDKATQEQGSKLDVYIGGISTDVAMAARGDALADDIGRAFQETTMDRAPQWIEGQRRGALNVLRYETRRPGEADVFRQWAEDEAPGFDIAVSVLLDYSQSMDWAESELAECAYATKRACDLLEIPCTVTLWDHDARTLWDANDRADHVPVIKSTGSTNPAIALADLENQRVDRPKHIVLIMTDGQWDSEWEGGKRHLAYFKDAGRLMVGFGFGDQSLANSLLRKGCDEAFTVENLAEIPLHLERILIRMA